MKSRPIIFSSAMVRAVLDGTKTQTRRIAKEFIGRDDLDAVLKRWPNQDGCPYGDPGDRLWVREAFYLTDDGHHEQAVYAADDAAAARHINEVGSIAARLGLGDQWLKRHTRLRPSIHMPRWASRIALELTGARVERLQDITEDDAKAEGVRPSHGQKEPYTAAFADIWHEIHGPLSWSENPFVWVLGFRRVAADKKLEAA